MNAYKKQITIEDPQKLILSDLPFKAGQKVEIIILAEDNPELEELRQKIDLGTEQIKTGKIQDGELVFNQLQAKLRDEYGLI
ncbi:MAG: hypothetical protein AB4372_02220 [Xenococcus sp. (in: cyanobacteria)]